MSKAILYLNFSKGWGGLEIFSFNLFNWLKNDYEIFFFVEQNSPLHKKLENEKNVFVLKTFKYFDIKTIVKIHNFVKEKNIGIIHTFKSSDIWFSVLSTKIFKIKNIKIIHHLQMLPTHKRNDIFHKFIYKYLDKIITISEQMNKRVKEYWPVKKDIVETLYYGIEPEKFDNSKFNKNEIKEKYKIPKNKIVIGIIGQICFGKGQHIILEAFNKLVEKRSDIALVISGRPPVGDENYFEDLKNYAKKNQIENNVIFTGFCENVPELLSAMDIFILGSKEESFGLVVIEAMAAGKIVIGTNAGGVPEIISDNENGFLYEPFNVEQLVKVIEKILIMPEAEKNKIIKNAIKTINDKFSLSIFLKKIKSIYEL